MVKALKFPGGLTHKGQRGQRAPVGPRVPLRSIMSLQSSDLVINGLSGDRFTFWTARFRIAGIVVVVNANNGSSGNSVDLAEFSGRFARSYVDRDD